MTDGIGETFMARTRYEAMGPSAQSLGRPQPPLEMPAETGAEAVGLPRPAEADAPVELTGAIERRRSVRDYAPGPLTPAELSYLLWCTQGVRRVVGGQATLRTVPSAGARHALETFLLVNRVAGLEAGLYRFLATGHKLARLRRGPESSPAGDLTAACLGQEFVAASAVTFVWAADAARMTWRYGQRGYRYLFLDAGHACQNLYLAAGAVGCGVCAIGAFDDGAVNELLGLDGRDRFAVYGAAVGRMP